MSATIRFRGLALAAMATVGMALTAVPASAHHSTANFDYTKTVVLNGTIKKFQWSNPHSFIQILVPDGKGGEVEWSIEAGSPTLERRLGWKQGMIKEGDKVSAVIAPVRAGGPSGTLRQITLPHGIVLYGPGNRGTPTDLDLPTLQRATPEDAK
jgi:hypothetical protein